jgi:hypothetical protein
MANLAAANLTATILVPVALVLGPASLRQAWRASVVPRI